LEDKDGEEAPAAEPVAAAAAAASADDGGLDDDDDDIAGAGSAKNGNGQLKQIKMPDGPISCVALSKDGKLVATADSTGTKIRVWDTKTGDKVIELFRGQSQATVFNMCFSDDNSMIAVCSSRGTLHLFFVTGDRNTKSKMSFFGGYFSGQWSACKLDSVPPVPCSMCFSEDHEGRKFLTAIFQDGTYRRAQLLEKKPQLVPDTNIGELKLLPIV